MDFTEFEASNGDNSIPGWLTKASGAAWGEVKSIGHAMADHKAASTAGFIAAAGVGALVLKSNPEIAEALGAKVCDAVATPTARQFDTARFWQVAQEQGFTGIKTIHPDRFLIRMPDYGYFAESAAKAENLIATTRDAIKSGEVKSAAELDRFVETRYHDTFLQHHFRYSKMERITEAGETDKFSLVLRGKHEPYNARLLSMLKKPGSSLTLNATFDGQTVGVTNARLHTDLKYGVNRLLSGSAVSKPRVLLEMPTDPDVIGKMNDRLEQLFKELTPGNADAGKPDMSKFGEFEWLSAHRYRERKSVAGITQVKVRAMLEALGYDSPRFKANVDPNLEALTGDMDQVKSKYGNLLAGKIHPMES